MTSVQAGSFVISRIVMPTPFEVGTVNAFLIRDREKAILVDCGMKYEPAKQALQAGLRAEGLEMRDIDALVLTHGHIDHVGLAAQFQAQGVPILAHPQVATWLEVEGPWTRYRFEFFEAFYVACGMSKDDLAAAMAELFSFSNWTDRSVVNEGLEDGSRLSVMPELEVVYVPGHAQHAIALFHEGSGTFVAGDQLLAHISSNAVIEPALAASSGRTAQRTKSLLDYRKNLMKLAKLRMGRVYPGHGDVFEGAEALIQERLAQQLRRKAFVYKLLGEHERESAFEMAKAMFPRHHHQGALILSETLGFLDWLQIEGQAVEELGKDGTWRWRRTDSLATDE